MPRCPVSEEMNVTIEIILAGKVGAAGPSLSVTVLLRGWRVKGAVTVMG